MEYGKGHVRIVSSPNMDKPYDWELDPESTPEATVTLITEAPSMERIAISSAVTVVKGRNWLKNSAI